MKKRKFNFQKIVLLSVLVLLVVVAYFIARSPTEGMKTNQDITEEQILTRLGLTNDSVKITRLNDLNDLKQKYPVIYENVKEGDYEVRNGNRLIIYDYEKDMIVKEFDVTNIRIG